MEKDEAPKKPRQLKAAFMPASDPGYFWRQKMEDREDADVIISFDKETRCLIVERVTPSRKR